MSAIKPMNLLTRLRSSGARRDADSYEEWKSAAIADDDASGAAQWKQDEQTRIFDYAAIRSRLDQLRDCRRRGDDNELLYALNEGVHGNMGGMGRAELYERARFGTKDLVSDYLDEMVQSLEHLAKVDIEGVSAAQKLEFFRRASLCFGRSALLLSGGGIFGYFHVGVIKALVEQDLLPGVISGSSAGSLIAAIVGTHQRDELLQAFQPENLQVRTRRAAARGGTFSRLLPRFSFDDIHAHIHRLVPDLTFAEAFQKTGIAINISISPAELHQTSRLMNAITSPDVHLRSAVAASCAVPGIYPPIALTAKNRHGKTQAYLPGSRWVDGSVSDDVPTRRLSRLYAVNHTIVSQVNPFALVHRPVQYSSHALQDLRQFWHHSSKNAARLTQSLTEKYGRRWPDLRYNVNSLMSVWMQDYGGDINILPPAGMVRPWKGLGRTSIGQLRDIIDAGEHAAWPRIEMIRNHTCIGRVLDRILAELESDSLPTPRAAVGIDWQRWARDTVKPSRSR